MYKDIMRNSSQNPVVHSGVLRRVNCDFSLKSYGLIHGHSLLFFDWECCSVYCSIHTCINIKLISYDFGFSHWSLSWYLVNAKLHGLLLFWGTSLWVRHAAIHISYFSSCEIDACISAKGLSAWKYFPFSRFRVTGSISSNLGGERYFLNNFWKRNEVKYDHETAQEFRIVA